MLAIRMQRTGRSGHAQFRVVVQDSRYSPTSGRVVEYLGSYNPHTKASTLDKEKATAYLSNGAQPSERVAQLLVSEGVKLPKWVAKPTKKQASIRNVEKLRRNRPAESEAPTQEAPVEEVASDTADQTEVQTEADAQAVATENETVATTDAEAPAEDAAPEPAEQEATSKEPASEEPAEA